MSRYAGSDYSRDRRDRSPPRFPDRRPSSTYNEPPRAPRSRELRDAPPLGRGFRDSRDYPPPRDIEPARQRRNSRDAPLTAGSTYSDPSPAFRGGFARGRGRGDSDFRPGRGGRRHDDRDLFRRERSPPPPRWTRENSRDRDPDRRDDRRFDRWDDNRRSDWLDRERDIDRPRRDQPPPPRAERRLSNDSLTGAPSLPSVPGHVNPDRLALIEDPVADGPGRRAPLPMTTQSAPINREIRRDQPEIPAYLDGRAETTSNRYSSRASSPPIQPPPVPAFTLSFAPSAQQSVAAQPAKPPQDTRLAPSQAPVLSSAASHAPPTSKSAVEDTAQSSSSNTQARISHAQPPLAAPKAPRAHESDPASAPTHRLQGVRSWETLTSSSGAPPKVDATTPASSTTATVLAGPPQATLSSSLSQPVSPMLQQTARHAEFSVPTGPKATRTLSGHSSTSPLPPFTSPRLSSTQAANVPPRSQTPPLSAPSGPRNRAFSVSPKSTFAAIPTAPKADRFPPSAPRGPERGMPPGGRIADRNGPPGNRLPPTAPRAQQWNQWRRAGPQPQQVDKTVPVKRDYTGEEKGKPFHHSPNINITDARQASRDESHFISSNASESKAERSAVEPAQSSPKPGSFSGHSAQQSFFGKPVESTEDEPEFSDAADETMSTSDEDEIEFEDLALFEAKFERQRRELEAKLVNLASREFRATTPLESIARLARVSIKDLERFKEREPEMDIDEPRNDRLRLPGTHSSESDEAPDLLTPKGEENASVMIHEADDATDIARRVRRPTPEVISLPYLTKTPQLSYHESEEYVKDIAFHRDIKDALALAMTDDFADEQDEEEDLEARFARYYRRWREECEDFDREREEQERLERQLSLEPGPEPEMTTAMPTNPVLEGRRLHKFSSEYEIEQVLKQSEETARIEQERADREAKKAQADMEKEAVIPDQVTEEQLHRNAFVDNNRFRDPESLTIVFAYEPPPDDFTEQEQHIFIGAFKETPKKWSEIASLLPGRSAVHCIRHYYANKWDGRFRDNRARKGKNGRRGRGGRTAPRGKGSAAMADLARAEDLVQTVNVSDSGRPKRAAAPTTFAERETDAKAALVGQSPAKKLGANSKTDGQGENGAEKPTKRRKGMGEKPGRKPKVSQPLAQLAAAPTLSPDNRVPSQQQQPQTKEDLSRSKALEDASLLAGLQSGRPGMQVDHHALYMTEAYMPHRPHEDTERMKPQAPVQSSAKSGPSSYWSVPEQSDFVKYIAHFGTDFGAIAAHMGTKTQTMIKNHYQRQIDGGNRPELEDAANTANARRERGENIGAPPTPTPITKRKYDNPQTTVQRPLAPHGDPMDIDESTPSIRAPVNKHASPPQYQMQPRYPAATTQGPPAQAQLVPAHQPPPPPEAMVANPPAKNYQGSVGNRIGLYPESRAESRPTMQATTSSSSFRSSQHGTPTGQPAQPSRTVQEAQDPQYIKSLLEEQKRAMRLQGHYHEQDRVDQFHHRNSLQPHQQQHQQAHQQQQQQQTMHHSPAAQPPQMHAERKVSLEERANTPPVPFFSSTAPTPTISRTVLEPPGSYPYDPMRYGPSRHSAIPSPPKREDARPNSVSNANMQQQTIAAPAPLPEPPKRSNLLSILNSDTEEPKAPKIGNLEQISPGGVQRSVSPFAHGASSAPPPPPFAGTPHSRLDAFGHQAMGHGHSHYQHAPVSQAPGPVPSPAPSSLKQEPLSAGAGHGMSSQIPPKQEWSGRMGGQGTHTSPANPPPAFERDVRPYYSHRSSILGPLNTPARANPSPPPPHGMMQHSRTPSMSTQGPSQPPPNDSRAYMPGQPSGVPLQANPYAQPPTPSYSQPPPAPSSQATGHAHHGHNQPIGGYAPMHQRGMSREDNYRHEQAYREREREREEREWRLRQEEQEAERRRMEAQQLAQRQHEQERHYSRGGPPPPPPPMHPPFGSSSYEQGPPRLNAMGMREQSMREVEYAMEAERRRHGDPYRERDQAEEARRRHDEAFLPGARSTPLGGGFGAPNMPGPGRR